MDTVLAGALSEFWERWQGAGFRLSTDALLQVERVLRSVSGTVTPERLGGLLGPLLAKTPEAQVRFTRIFADCFPQARALVADAPLPRQRTTLRGSFEIAPTGAPLPAPPEKTFLDWVREAREHAESGPVKSVRFPYHQALVLPGKGPFRSLKGEEAARVGAVVRRRGVARQAQAGTALAVRPTIAATLAAGGRPQLICEPSLRRRQVVAVVEFTGHHDHRVFYYLSLLWQLDRLGVEVQVFGWNVKLSQCHPLHRGPRGFVLRGDTKPLPLPQVGRGALREESLLLYCGSGEATLVELASDSVVLTPEAQALARGWKRAVLFTLSPPRRWERALAGRFECRSASWSGLEALLAPAGRRPLVRRKRVRSTELTVAGLERRLPEGAFRWLCACASLPELRWDLTQDFGHRLGVASEENLLALLDLPWFCGEGQATLAPLPSELRLDLAACLPDTVRKATLKQALAVLNASDLAEGTGIWKELGQEQAALEWRLGHRERAKGTLKKLAPYTHLRDLREHPVLRELIAQEEEARFESYPALKAYLERMVNIPSGTFERGSEDYDNEKPIHLVTLSRFWLGQTPVTVAVWREYCAATGTAMPEPPDWDWIPDHPMVNVSWEDCQKFCQWASGVVGVEMVLPTEAQWEYAARSGKGGQKFPWGKDWDESKLWCSTSTFGDAKHTAPVFRKERTYTNAFGLIDMAGNVWEWCNDWYGGKYDLSVRANPKGPEKGDAKVLRGGSWFNYGTVNFRCAIRNRYWPEERIYDLGFRLSSPPPPTL